MLTGKHIYTPEHAVFTTVNEAIILNPTLSGQPFDQVSTFGFWKNQDLRAGLFNYKSNSFPTGQHKLVVFEVFLSLQ